MTSRQFNNLFSDSSNSNCFSLFHLNIRSFKKHSVDLEEYLSTLNTSFSAIGLSETWLDNTSNDLYIVSIPGYHFISKPRPVGPGGGVGIFLCDTYEYKKRCDLESMNCVLESVFVEIVQPKNEKNVILGCLYKPPNVQTEIFNDEIKQVLAKIGFENKLCFLFGDFNINILNANSHVPTNDFIDLMYSNGFYPLISKPTRITSHSATLIDNIFSNDLDNHKFSGILWSDISDHLLIFQITNCSLKPKTKSSVYHKRLVMTDNIENFRSHLCSINWDFSQSSSSNALYNNKNYSFMDCLYPIYETCFPVKIITVKENSKAKPWFTSGLQNSCRRKYALHKQYCNNPTPANKTIYTKFRNKYNYLIKLRRKKYYHDKLSSIGSSLIQKTINLWSMRGMSLFGKVTIIKTFLIPKMLYVSSIIETPYDILRRMERMIYKFLWKGPDKVTRNSVVNMLEQGGLNLTDIETQIKALRLSWIPRILDERKGAWKSYFNFQLRNQGGVFLLSCNYDVNDLNLNPYWLLC